MAAIVNTSLAGFTVDYNGVQFGGFDSPYLSFPPQYHFSADPIWDSSHRAIVAIQCKLFIRCIFYEDSETLMATNMRNIRASLQQPGRLLKLSGLGSGFDWVNPAVANLVGDVKDIAGGPHPMPLEMNPIGQLCWELVWGLEFTVSTCAPFGFDALAFTSFNFSTTWRNDFEGYSTRIIQGKVGIPFTRNAASPKTVLHVAEEKRGTIVVKVPPGFKRIENIWHEGEDKHTLEFTIVDHQLQGDPYPAGITQADGNFAFNTGSKKGNAMNEAIATLSVTMKTAYNQPKNLAGQVFMAMLLAKQAEIQAEMTAIHAATPNDVPLGQILPLHFAIQSGKFDSARMTQAQVSWYLVQDFNSLLQASKIFDPMPGVTQDYTVWKTTMDALWGNRGTTGIDELASEAVIIDLCDNKVTHTIGTVGSSPNNPVASPLTSLTCPSVPDNGGWLHFDLDIKVLREEQVSRHIRAASYIPSLGAANYEYNQQPNTGNNVAVNVGGQDFSQSSNDQEAIEYHGFPKFYIGLSFSGLRFKHTPYVPSIKSVGGQTVREYGKQQVGTPKHAMDSFGCPVWSVSGYRVYSVPGKVTAIKPVSSLTAADTSIPLEL